MQAAQTQAQQLTGTERKGTLGFRWHGASVRKGQSPSAWRLALCPASRWWRRWPESPEADARGARCPASSARPPAPAQTAAGRPVAAPAAGGTAPEVPEGRRPLPPDGGREGRRHFIFCYFILFYFVSFWEKAVRFLFLEKCVEAEQRNSLLLENGP